MSNAQIIRKGYVSARTCQLSEEDVKTLLLHIGSRADSARRRGTKRGIIDELMVFLLIHTGVRVNELCELDVANLLISEDGVASIEVGGDSPRNLPVPVDLFDKFQRYMDYYRDKNTPESPLLVSEQGNRISSQNVYLKIKSIGKKAGLDDLHPYMIRHYFLCQLYEQEHDLKLVQKAGGYKDPKTAAKSLNLLV